jgi:hypothetical protein
VPALASAAIVHDAIENSDWGDPDLIPPEKDSGVLAILYVGQLYEMQHRAIEALLDAGRASSRPLRMGICSNSQFRYKSCETVQIENFGWVSESDLCKIAEGFQYGLMPMSFESRDWLLYRTSLMTKIVSYLRVGLPIIAVGPSDSATAQLLHREGIGVNIATLEPSALVTAIKELESTACAEYARLRWKVQHCAATTFNLDAVAGRFYSTIWNKLGSIGSDQAHGDPSQVRCTDAALVR